MLRNRKEGSRERAGALEHTTSCVTAVYQKGAVGQIHLPNASRIRTILLHIEGLSAGRGGGLDGRRFDSKYEGL